MADKIVPAKPAAAPVSTAKPVKPAPIVKSAPAVAKPAPVAKATTAAKPVVAAAKPVVAAAQPAPAKPAPAPPVAAPAPEPAAIEHAVPKTEPAAPMPVAEPTQKGPAMTETMTNAAADMQNRATAMIGDMNTRAKDAVTKGSKAIEEIVEFSKGNLEAMMTSGRVAAKGAEEIAKYSTEYGRATIERANAAAKQFAAVKSPTEFFQLQGDIAKQTLDALVAEGSKFTENYLKLIGEMAQPISNRVAVAADKVKATTTA